jgi:NAD(P)-dependent dehydrogenase (short-subunit alcohol dehydrogenase family)
MGILKGKLALVTGASRGIGRAMAQAFAEAGWAVAGCSTRSSALEFCDLAAVCDVADAKQVGDFVGQVHARSVVNNAGVAGAQADWHRVFDVNLHGTYYVTQAALPWMGSGGRVINIASILGLKGVPDQPAYCAAKHGVIGYTRSLVHALAPLGITANAICPGWTRTDMAAQRLRELGLTEAQVGRMTEPAEVAALALYLCSPAAAGVNGQALTIDGGASA